MSKLVKKLLVSVFASLVLLMSVAPAALAQSTNPWYSQDFGSWYSKVYDKSNPTEIFGERYTAAQVQWVIFGFASMLINFVFHGNIDLATCFVSTQATGNVNPCVDSINGFIKNVSSNFSLGYNNSGGVIGEIFADRSLSGITYVKDIGRKFHLIPEAQAQTAGFGYSGALGVLPEVQKFWTVTRDLSYAIFVFIIIVFAFMIMFRVKISPQAVVTVQSALPKIAITLVLVTFSYAIAGFLIDLMYVVIGVFSLIFSRIDVFGVGFAGLQGVGITPVQGYFDLLTRGPAFLGQGLGIFGLMVMYLVNLLLGFLVSGIGGIVVGWCGGGGGLLGATLGGSFLLIGIIAFIVILIISIINFFRIVIVLAKAFMSVILLTVFAPLQLTLGTVLPGLGFGAWVRSLAAKLAVFPGVGVMFVISLWLIELAWQAIHDTQCNVGLVTGVSKDFAAGWPPLLGGSRQMVSLAFLFASMGVFVMIPKVADMVEGLIAGKGFNFGTALGEATKPVVAPIVGIGGAAFGAVQKGAGESIVNYVTGTLAQQGGRTGRLGQAARSVVYGNEAERVRNLKNENA